MAEGGTNKIYLLTSFEVYVAYKIMSHIRTSLFLEICFPINVSITKAIGSHFCVICRMSVTNFFQKLLVRAVNYGAKFGQEINSKAISQKGPL